MFGIQKRRLTDGTVIGHLVDLLIDPEYRGQGIFARSYTLAVAHFDNLEAVSVLPNLNGKDACVKSLGMQSIAKIDDLVLHGKVAAPEKTLPSPVTHSPSLAFATDARFRRWRYEQSPLYRYTIMGTAVTKAFKDPKSGDEFGDIVDWTETPRPEAILTACNELLASGQKSVSTWALPHTERYAHVRQLGFKPLVRERYFCIRALHPSKDYLYDINQWQLVPADAEIY
jgi:hypothetical protein